MCKGTVTEEYGKHTELLLGGCVCVGVGVHACMSASGVKQISIFQPNSVCVSLGFSKA